MNTLFSPDSTLMRGLSTVADLMLLNLIFIATSLPVVTLGASLTALNFTAMRIATGECNSVTGDYLRSFRRNFRQATIIGLVLALMAGVLAAWFVVVTNLAFGTLAELLLLAVWYVLAFTLVTTALFAFPYLASFEGRTRDVLRNARLLSWKHPVTAIAALAVIGLCAAATVFYPHVTGFGLFWFLVGFAGIATINGRLFAGVFQKYIAAASGER
ncbi:YesL family protein [Devosia sp. ZB163]|uniref:YesL family protein n=1 Tax=Devosia sp. ZB163 TaxID=3025938 RepID=UPI00235E02F9|nr:YesL family protein [Devosia sp. ZB163]MDC9825328.1 YesL family protein [Devosia sp. ZB163]